MLELAQITPRLLRNFLVKPLSAAVLRQRFRPGEVVRGKILQVIPDKQFFVLHVKGMNLVARSKIALFAGDRIKGKITDNRGEVEVKLLEVNGRPVHGTTFFTAADVQFVRIPLAENLFGPRSFLQIYPDGEKQQSSGGPRRDQAVHLILESRNLQRLVLDLRLSGSQLSGKVWVERPDLLRFLQEKEAELRAWLESGELVLSEFYLLPLNRDVSFFRREWLHDESLDVRA